MKGLFLSVAAIVCGCVSSVEGSRKPYGFPEYDQKFLDGYNKLKYTASLGPYSNRQSFGIDRDPPEGCSVDQVLMLHRHGTRYPDNVTGPLIQETINKFLGGPKLNGSLEFANHWQNFLIESYLQLEYAAGPYNGLADAYQRGADYAIRYGHLWDGESVVPIFAGGYERVLQTGRKFGEGFLGYNYSTLAAVQVIPETAVSGANSVAPVCNAEVLTTCNVANKTSLNALLSPFLMPEFQVAANRLNIENPALNATAVDVYYLLQLAAYEIAYRGNSQWAEVFTDDEFLAFDYAFSLLYYCYYGPGSPTYGQQIGSVFANASLTVLKQGPEVAGTMFWTFSHDAYVTAALSAMGILMPSEPSLDKVNFNYMKTYKISDIVPMAGHLTIERLSCSAEVSAPYISANQTDNGMPVVNATATYGSANVSGNQTYVRLVLNEAVLPIDGCIDGPGYSCSLDSYDKFLSANLANFDYVKACNISQSLPQYLDFFWNWNHTTAHNYPSGPVPYQATYVTN